MRGSGGLVAGAVLLLFAIGYIVYSGFDVLGVPVLIAGFVLLYLGLLGLFKSRAMQDADASSERITGEILQSILEIYDRCPPGEGVHPGTPEAQQLADLGGRLHDTGGSELMLSVHERFRRRNPLLARDLEHRWDGVGSWRG